MERTFMSETPSSKVADSDLQIEAIRDFYRAVPQVSGWFEVNQALIDQFATLTRDEHWIHTDPERAAREGPYGGTVAHGFCSLAMLPHLLQSVTGDSPYPPEVQFAVNYGLDRVRFVGPARSGSRIRLCYKLVEIAARGNGHYLIRTENTVEAEGQEKPVLVADWLFLFVCR